MGRRRVFVRSIRRAGPLTRLFGSTVGMGLALAASSARGQTPPTESKEGKDDVSLPGADVRGQRNQVSKTPKLAPFYELSGTVGSGPQGRLAVDVNQPIGGSGAVRLNLMGFKGETPGRDYIEQQRLGAAPSFGIGLNGPTRLIVSYFYFNDDNMPDYGFPYLRGGPAPVRHQNFYGFPNPDY